MNNNRKDSVRGGSFAGVSRILWSIFSDTGTVGSHQPTGQWKSACLCCHVINILPGISGGMLLTERWETGTWLSRKNKKVNKLVFTVLIFSQMIFYTIGVSMEPVR